MTRFNPRIGAAVLVGLGLCYLVAALWSGHSATAQPPPDLSAPEAGLDVWHALALVAREKTTIVDLRPSARRRVHSVPHSLAVPGGDADDVRRAAGQGAILLLAPSDAEGAKVAGELRKRHKRRAHFLQGGVRAWYLALELPVALFAETPPPRGYEPALSRVRAWVRRGFQGDAAAVRQAIGKLAATPYSPTLLGKGTRPKSSGKKKKKITGGCG